MPEKLNFAELVEKHNRGLLSVSEKAAFFQLFEREDLDPEIEEYLWQNYQQNMETAVWPDEFRELFAARMAKRIFQQTNANAGASSGEHMPGKSVRLLKTTWFRYAAAIIILLGAGAWLFLTLNKRTDAVLTNNDKQPAEKVIPGKDGAVLTLADGTQVVLDSLGNGIVADQNGSQVLLKDGSLAYRATAKPSAEPSYNTMSTPNGRQFRLVLPDGSKVWLNAASSIRYPTVFARNERVVAIKGEAYFEVEKNKNAPFKVKVNDATVVEVLGTGFNINAYENEEAIKTTLIQGAVKVNTQPLTPGQQAEVYPDETLKVVNGVDTSRTMAWKNGYFDFSNADLPVMMRQLERWYDITVTYKGQIPRIVFKGQMDRNVQLADVIRFLTAFGIKTSLQGRTLFISGS